MNKVYIVVADFGYYMEPDIRILKVFISKTTAENYARDFSEKKDLGYYELPVWIISEEVCYE